MSEDIYAQLEEMIPDLEWLQLKGIFTKKEIKGIVAKRKEMEYSLRAATCPVRSWTRAIRYELGLQTLVDMRCPSFLKGKVRSITKRINVLYARALHRFRRRPELYKPLFFEMIPFVQVHKSKSDVSIKFARAVRQFPMDTDFWVAAAQWELEENGNPENARGLYHQALRLHTANKDLHVAYFTMEMRFAEFLLRQHVKNLMHEIVLRDIPFTVDEAQVRDIVSKVVKKVAGVTFGQRRQDPSRIATLSGKPRFVTDVVVRLTSKAACVKAVQALDGSSVRFAQTKRVRQLSVTLNDGSVEDTHRDSLSQEKLSLMTGQLAVLVYEGATEGALGDDVDFHLRFLEQSRKLVYSTELQTELCKRIYHRFPTNPRCLFRYIARKLYFIASENASVKALLEQKQRQDQQLIAMRAALADTMKSVLARADLAVQYIPGPPTLEEYLSLIQSMEGIAETEAQQAMLTAKRAAVETAALQSPHAADSLVPHAPRADERVEGHDDPDLVVHFKPITSGMQPPAQEGSLGARQRQTQASPSVSFFLTLARQREESQQGDGCLAALQMGLEAHPKDSCVWLELIKATVRLDPHAEHSALFRQAVTALGSAPTVSEVWRLFVAYTAAKAPLGDGGFQTTSKVMQEAIVHVMKTAVESTAPHGLQDKHRAIAGLCEQYLGFCEARGGPDWCPTACSWLLRHTSLPLEVYLKLISVKEAQPDASPIDVRALYEVCLDLHGKHNTGLWLQYAQYELQHEEFARAQALHARATRVLEDPRDFQRRYQQMLQR